MSMKMRIHKQLGEYNETSIGGGTVVGTGGVHTMRISIHSNLKERWDGIADLSRPPKKTIDNNACIYLAIQND